MLPNSTVTTFHTLIWIYIANHKFAENVIISGLQLV